MQTRKGKEFNRRQNSNRKWSKIKCQNVGTVSVGEFLCVQQTHFPKTEDKRIHVKGDTGLTKRGAVPSGTQASNKKSL